MERRRFLSTIGAVAASAWLPSALRGSAWSQTAERPPDDNRFIDTLLRRAVSEHLAEMPMHDLVVAVGRTMIGMPYAGNTLEQPGEEHLVVNLHEFDCVTFCESSLALARAIKLHGSSPADYARQLQYIRYRGGEILGYQSRLHYFTDWVEDNESKLTLRNITHQLGGRRDRRSIRFMSEHQSAYPRLADKTVLEAIEDVERRLTGSERYFLPKEMVHDAAGSMRNGDIVGVTTSISGLDCSHTGIVVEEKSKVKLLHASLDGKQVMLTAGTLDEYLAQHDKQTGIIVARPMDPSVR
jgi:hypothetical protein